MCGRYSFALTEGQIQAHFNQVEIAHRWRNSYNIAPTQHAFVITNTEPQKVQSLAWGLIPYWNNSGQNKGKLINARMEGIEAKPSFRIPFRERRCLVLADSYYEWKAVGSEKKPYRILLHNQPLLVMAGIWDVWTSEDYTIKTFSIITAPSNDDVSYIHSRMPAILESKEKQKAWLSDLNLAQAQNLLNTLPTGLLRHYPVTTRLSNVSYNEPKIHIELPHTPDLFA